MDTLGESVRRGFFLISFLSGIAWSGSLLGELELSVAGEREEKKKRYS